ncbi:hypothetical protein B0W44_02380 [Novibacillus thermophilus]|uniref:Glycerol operon regulatory protein n=1 Tax=Novibacillus thermophilus TaxID=1471761 RepID=A0A1U9K429_9BACL|nr:IclR family transcriptional regulator [Novibacillus thermophilus]AQS54788.1 hypothetical protein B0W44_02380 [Novibacillus thermophilus]
MTEEKLVNAVVRSLNILETLADEEEGLGITEISQRLGLAKSTTHRLMMTLHHKGYVVQDEKTENYKLGLKILSLYSSLLENLSLRKVAHKHMEELANKVGETVHLVIRDDCEVVYIDKVESSKNTIRVASQIGKRAYMHSTAVGKVLLSELSWAEVEHIIREKGLPRFTKNTITEPGELKRHLQNIKNNGWAIDNVENEEGIRCIAAPIRDRSGKIVAAISISGPVFRVTEERIQYDLIPSITRTIKLMSNELGYNIGKIRA